MAVLQTHKVVAQLPASLEPNAIYFVRRSTGYDQFVTNGAGVVVAYLMNVRIPAAVPGYLVDGSMLRLTMNPDGQLPARPPPPALNLQHSGAVQWLMYDRRSCRTTETATGASASSPMATRCPSRLAEQEQQPLPARA